MPSEDIVLSQLGIPEPDELVYRLLLERPALSVGDIATALDSTPQRARGSVTSLVDEGLVARAPGKVARYVALPPEVAVEALFVRRKSDLERGHAMAMSYLKDVARGSRDQLDLSQIVSIVEGKAVLRDQFRQIEASAQQEVLIFDKPPYASGPQDLDESEIDFLSRGVKYRVVYERDALEIEGRLAEIERYISAGEEARVVPHLPVKLFIVDGRIGVIPLSMSARTHGAAIVHASLLLDALKDLFESYWDAAAPILEGVSPSTSGMPFEFSEQDGRILRLLAAGVKDASIARQLGVTTVTVRRRVAKLYKELGAETRFQAGIAACRRGWV